MAEVITVNLSRDVEAVQIPAGTPATLAAGTPVHITQTLGGSFTVQAGNGLFRIPGKDAEALGQETPDGSSHTGGSGSFEDQIWEALKAVYDPEIPVNIVDLGLVYDLRHEDLPDNAGKKVFVKMTLTAPGCGMGPVIAGDAQNRILELDGVEDASVEVVWDPPWHQSMISPEGRKILGIEG